MTKITQINPEDGDGHRRIHLREISADSEAPLETVGQDMRAARLRRGDDLATVSRALKIRKDHLEAVEQDDFTRLPGKTYAVGFVRSYASYLGLDVNQTVERYKQEITGRRDEHLPTNPGFHADERRLSYGWRIAGVIVVLALAYGAWHLVSGGSTPLATPPAPSLNPPRPQARTEADTPTPPAPQAANNSAPPALAASQAASNNAPPVPAKPQMVAAPPQGAMAMPAIDASGEGRVVLRANAPTRITIKGEDGNIYANRDLEPGDSYQVPRVPGLSLAIADAGAVDVLLDGRVMGKVGQNNQVLGRVSLDPSSLVDRFNTR